MAPAPVLIIRKLRFKNRVNPKCTVSKHSLKTKKMELISMADLTFFYVDKKDKNEHQKLTFKLPLC